MEKNEEEGSVVGDAPGGVEHIKSLAIFITRKHGGGSVRQPKIHKLGVGGGQQT